VREHEIEVKEEKVRYNEYLYRTLYPFVKMALTGQKQPFIMRYFTASHINALGLQVANFKRETESLVLIKCSINCLYLVPVQYVTIVLITIYYI